MGLIQAPELGLSLRLLWPYILKPHQLRIHSWLQLSQRLLIRVCYKGCQQRAGTLLTLYVGRFELKLKWKPSGDPGFWLLLTQSRLKAASPLDTVVQWNCFYRPTAVLRHEPKESNNKKIQTGGFKWVAWAENIQCCTELRSAEANIHRTNYQKFNCGVEFYDCVGLGVVLDTQHRWKTNL